MQKDSVHSTTPGHMMHNEPVPQDSTVKSFHCSRCPLSFKSKVFLFEHLNNVHDYSVDASLRDAGLTGTNKASNDKNSDRTKSTFECQHCDFKACSLDDFKTHETCHKESDNQNVKEKTTSIISANQKAPGAKEISSSAMSTSKTKCTPNSSKDLKTYKKPIQTITKYFKASGSNGLSAVGSTDNPTLLDGTRDMLILQESPLSSGQKSSGVFKVSAKPMIDLSAVSQQFLLNDYLLNADLTPPTPKGHIKEAVFNNAGKRTCNESLISSPAKKVKVAREGKQDLLSSAEFSFEVSEDEEETSINLVNGDMESPKVYSCKHCDYSDVGIQGVSTHYQSDHPYVRYTSDYIQDPINQSATFRCLHCPIEFVSVASLKKHYTKNHPEAPNVFKMQLRELHLVFKCFLCSFTINALKSLRRHYKEKHPTHEVNNALMYSKYLATTSQEGSSQLNACEKTPSSERISTESAPVPCEEVKNAPSSQHATSKGADVALFQCNKCKFSHKSVVVMHVHYQKSHPEEAITIDKIKQSSLVTSQTTPEKMSEPQKSGIITDKSTPQKKISDSQIQETKEKAKMPQQKISVAQINLKLSPETSKTHSESPKTKKVESAGDRTPAKQDRKMSTEMEHVSPTSPNAVFYCQFCSYSSTKIKSVVCHHNAKHSLHTQVGIQEIVKHSAEVRKKKLQSEAKATASASLSTSVTKCHAFARAEDLFYCQKCNYGNPTVKGVTTHQSKLHTSCKFSTESVIEYTALIRDEIKKSKSQAKESSISTGLPLPLLNEGDEHMFFCHFCNYRQSSMSRIVHHYSKTHCGFVSNAKEIRLHTSMVLEQTKKLPLKATANQEVDQTPVKEKRNKKKKTKGPGKSSSVSVSSSKKASQAQKTLQCPRCAYITQHVYLLRRHTRKMHGSHFKQGNLQSGYHCEYCVFSHKKATILDKHYQDKHPGRRPCVDLITARSNVGPGTSTPLRSGENETEIYPCRACSFKGSSVSGITDHYRSVHPWSVKEDGSVLDVINRKKPSAKKKMEDHSEISGSFESYQVPLEFDNSLDSPQEATESSTELKCPHCPAQFHADHSLKTHLGVEHRQNVTEEELQEEQLQVQTNVHIFKCPHCSYVNTNCEEVLCHCLKEHPTLESRADSLHVEEEHLNLQKGCSKGTDPDGMLRYIGYVCKTCPQIHSTLEELSKHCEEDHNQSVPNTPETALKPAQQSKTHRTQGSVKQGFSFKKKTHAVISCQVCFYKCTTKVALRQHMHTYHNNTPASSAQDCAYKCVICSKSFSQTRCLGYHYTRIHGKDAFHKYYAPVYHNVLKKSATPSANHPSSHMAENTSDASQSSTATEKNKKNVFKCPKCPYVNASHHGILTHCQMGHPALVARADDLKTIEILVTNMVGCKLGKSSNERGYMCKICPQIHASLKKLKIHLERDHGKEGSHKHNAKGNMPQPPPSVQEKFKCDMCAYSGARRRYLWRHYKVIHKLDALATSRRLVKYNKLGTKINYLPEAEPDSEESGQIKCKKCPNLVFYSLEMLSTHYSTSHSSDCKLDFVVLYPLSKKYKWVYKCCHCKKRLNGIKNLSLHMDYHKRKKTMENAAEEMAARTEASLVDTMTPEAKSTELCEQDELPALETVEEPHQSNVTMPTSPLSSPSKPADVEEPDQSNVTLPTSPLSSPSKPADVEEPDQSNVTLPTSPLSSPSKPADVEEPDQSNVTLPTSPLSSPSKPADVEEPDQSNVTLPTSPLSSPSKPADVEEPDQSNVTLPTCPLSAPSKPADVEEPDQSNVTLPTSPLSSPSKPADVQEPEPESREDKHTCKQCALTFMSLKGLRCHERSHAAVAAIKKLDNLPTSALKHTSMDKYVVFKSGTRRPFRCSICPYKTTVMALWKNHFIKSHQDIIMNPAETDNQDTENTQMAEKEPPNSSEELNNLPEPDEEPEISQRSMYLEPPEVQRQLNHFSLMAEAGPSSKAKVQDPKLPVNGLLHCEFCNFTTEHSSSIRRHLLNRHGKKMLRCKDCNFFTGLKKNLEMHIETGHSTFESGPTHQKDLRCPFCLYQTKNKNNMIDHIILHREERVVPIEVRRPKLSRYLQGIVFRCHKCTFTSASAENLHLHMKRHDDIKPYKCRLCYFDCSQLCNLEAHLCDKHQVVRNHALVGQVSLDQLEARGGRAPEEEEEEEPVSNLENNTEVEYVETEELVMDCNEVSDDTHAKNPAVNFLRESMKLQIPQRQGSRKANAVSLTRHSAFILQCKNIANPNAAVPEKHGQDPQERTQNEMSSPDAAKRQGVEKRAEPKVAEDNSADVHFVDCSYPEKERQMSEKQLGGSGDSRKMAMQKREEAAEGRLAGKAQARKLQMKAFQDRTSNIEAKVEDDILRHILLLDDDGSIHRTPRKAGYDRLVKIEQDIENEVVENVFSKIILLNEEDSITSAPKKHPEDTTAVTPKKNQECFTAERHLLSLTPNSAQVKMSRKKRVDKVSHCKEEHVHNQTNCEKLDYGAMPVLEKEPLNEEPLTRCKEEEEAGRLEKRQDRGDKVITETNKSGLKDWGHAEGSRMKEADDPCVSEGAVTAVDGAAEVRHSAVTEKKLFTCEFCGRNLTSRCELERHILRHGL